MKTTINGITIEFDNANELNDFLKTQNNTTQTHTQIEQKEKIIKIKPCPSKLKKYNTANLTINRQHHTWNKNELDYLKLNWIHFPKNQARTISKRKQRRHNLKIAKQLRRTYLACSNAYKTISTSINNKQNTLTTKEIDKKEKIRAYQKRRYQLLKKKGICPKCQRNPHHEINVLCSQCLERDRNKKYKL